MRQRGPKVRQNTMATAASLLPLQRRHCPTKYHHGNHACATLFITTSLLLAHAPCVAHVYDIVSTSIWGVSEIAWRQLLLPLLLLLTSPLTEAAQRRNGDACWTMSTQIIFLLKDTVLYSMRHDREKHT